MNVGGRQGSGRRRNGGTNMSFVLATRDTVADIYVEEQALAGVVRLAGTFAGDIELVTGKCPRLVRNAEELGTTAIVVTTVGHGDVARKVADKELAGKREVFRISMERDLLPGVEQALVICGSDKRGTIYGMFYISRLLGVSPWVDFANVMPAKQETVELSEDICHTSKEPSVRYRGFFINDEWPSFGNWTVSHHGGFTAEMYERVFTLLLRLNGNYMWPAMWSSTFAEDGPGLLSAELADEMGVVMGNSHHEPCLRAGEEFDHVKGEASIYGNEWNFYTNREGLLNFWRDGLKRGGHLESIITIGMRGERDTSMLGPDATLRQNIELLRDIIRQQRMLIAEHVNPDVSKVPQLLALYKEVEAYFYGDADTPGLIGWDELEDVILLLCEDNYGNMRTLPTEEMRSHRGGYGMYYHFDYHGGPISYEWVNSTQLEKVWEQMTQAYESGVRELWIVNVGDLKPQELPLTYFMDLAYDYETYGIDNPNKLKEYRLAWAKEQFEPHFPKTVSEEFMTKIERVLDIYTKLNNTRRPETLNAQIYHLVEDREAGRVLAQTEEALNIAEELRRWVSEEGFDSFVQLVYYPVVASMNLIRMQIFAAVNEVLLAQQDPTANRYAWMVEECIEKDAELIREYHSVANGAWEHMMSSKHIGFCNWNDEGSAPPTVHRLEEVLEGTYTPQEWAYLTPAFDESMLYVSGETECAQRPAWLSPEQVAELPDGTFVMNGGVLVMEAEHFAEQVTVEGAEYRVLDNYGRGLSSVKAFPVTVTYSPDEESPSLVYRVCVPESGDYKLILFLAPGNPSTIGGNVRYGVQVGDGMLDIIESIPEGFVGGDCFNWQWSKGVLENIHYSTSEIALDAGVNTIRIKAIDSAMVIQRIMVIKNGTERPKSYLGPVESWKK